MILKEATIKYKGYDPNILSKSSHKRICCSCDICGRVRWSEFYQYRDLCRKCKMGLPEMRELQSKMHKGKYCGKNNPNYGKKHSDETKEKMRNNHADYTGENNPFWKGGLPLRTHVLPERDCIKLNSRFKGSEGHHLTSRVMIFIPKYIHRSIYHNLKSGQGVNEINKLALHYLEGDKL